MLETTMDESKPSAELVRNTVVRVGRSISGYCTGKADDGTNLANGLGCTLAGFGAVYNTNTVLDALCVRRAANERQHYATYVVANMAHLDEQKLKNYEKAGWKMLAEMPGAHGSYKSYLLGATTFKTEAELNKAIREIWGAEKEPVVKKVKKAAKKVVAGFDF